MSSTFVGLSFKELWSLVAVMASTWFSCEGCSTSDPAQDTVKVNPLLLNKENVQPNKVDQGKGNVEQQKREAAELEARRYERCRKEEAAAAAEAARVREEADRMLAENAQRQEAARREAAERTAKRIREEQAMAVADAAAAAAAAAAAEEQELLEAKLDAEKKATEWCKKNGFQNIHTPKKTFRGATKYPLHTAVKHKHEEMVGMLLLAGAQKNDKDSNNLTPSDLAAKLNKDGSHVQILSELNLLG